MAHTKNGLLISLEGIDGSGKSTLLHALAKAIRATGRDVLVTQQPGGTVLGKSLRVMLHEEKEHVSDMAEYLLFAADRAQHFEEVVLPALEAGKIVISDRMNDSSVAYQGFGRNLDLEKIKSINEWAMRGRFPDLVFYLKLDFPVALERIMLRGGKLTSFETEKELFWQRVCKGYETIFKNRDNVVALDATKTPDELTKLATEEVLKKL